MLSSLHLHNFALIDDLSLELGEGLNVLTGETGAGKSILIGAINLILGERSSIEQIRSGADLARVEAFFHCSAEYLPIMEQLTALGIEPASEIIVSREISQRGRNICRINGRAVPLSTLKELGSLLVDLHGQHHQQSLLKTENHLLMLDEFGGSALAETKDMYLNYYNQLQQIRHKLKSFGKNNVEREKNLELLRFQRDEIAAARLDQAEEDNLGRRLLLLDNMEKLIKLVDRAYGEIYEGGPNSVPVVDRLNSIKAEIASLQGIDPKLAEYLELLTEAATSLSELSHELFAYRESLVFSAEERHELESRLEVYRRIKRKYGPTLDDVLAFAGRCTIEIDFLENSAEQVQELAKEEMNLLGKLNDQAARLSSLRKETALMLEQGVKAALSELSMQDARFAVIFAHLEQPNQKGLYEVEFLFSSNRGEPLKPLARIISAGEMSRVMLALKSLLAVQDRIPTLIFDEIDSGIGGKTVQKVAERMSRLGLNHQVICVTHSSQIASAADHHYFIFKEIEHGRTYTRVNYLRGENRVAEIARLLDGGSADDLSREHALKLLSQNRRQPHKKNN